MSTHFSPHQALGQGAFALIGPLRPPGAGLTPHLCHSLAKSVVTPLLLYWVDRFTPNAGSISRLNTFWHKVQRWATKCFSSIPIGILPIESCLPPVLLLVSQQQRLAALRTVCSPLVVNPATERLYQSFPSLSSHRTLDNSRAHTRGLSSVYLTRGWKTPPTSPHPFGTTSLWTQWLTGPSPSQEAFPRCQ